RWKTEGRKDGKSSGVPNLRLSVFPYFRLSVFPVDALPFGMPPASSGYWRASRQARHSVVFAFPLLLLYELLAAGLSREQIGDVRNGADVLLKSVFWSLGGRYGMLAFSVLLFGAGAWLVWRDRRAHGEIRLAIFAGMFLESAGYAVVLGAVVFSLFHYVGRYGDEFTLRSFTFRAVAGLLFSVLYLTRGFGITAWSHALYDVLLSLWT